MDLNDLDRFLDIDPDRPIDRRARHLVEADARLLDELIEMRVAKKLTQDVVAERMGISQSAVAKIEAGDRDPRLSTLRRYAMAVRALVDHVVDDDEPVKVTTPPNHGTHMAEAIWPRPEVKVPEKAQHR